MGLVSPPFCVWFFKKNVSHILVLWLSVNNIRPWQKLLFLFYVKKYFRIKKRRRQKLMTLLINQVLYAPFDKMNMIHMTITKAQLQSFRWDLRYPSLKFYYPYLLKNFTIIKAIFFPRNRFAMSCGFFFLWLFNPYNYRDNPQLVSFWI